ncbi:MAG: hypothetical protein Q9M26_04490 [Mariprofundales bacterium]|nr:hypothetical protein [Mariprofundales bacterium]
MMLVVGCSIQPKVELVNSQTALERQLMGSSADLDREALLLAPSRGENPPPDHSALAYRKAVAGRAFRLDEINDWRQHHYLSERKDGLLGLGRARFPVTTPRLAARFQRLWRQENHDRTAIFDHIIATNPKFSATSRQELGLRFHQMIRRQP